jgi:hypothetical protein
VVALLAVRPEAHGMEDFTDGNTQATPVIESFFGAKPEAAQLPEALPAKPEATSVIPTTTDSSTAAAAETNHSGVRLVRDSGARGEFCKNTQSQVACLWEGMYVKIQRDVR